jgi:hypothetical protein
VDGLRGRSVYLVRMVGYMSLGNKRRRYEGGRTVDVERFFLLTVFERCGTGVHQSDLVKVFKRLPGTCEYKLWDRCVTSNTLMSV